MTARVLAISTSPRRHGNSEDALDLVLGYFGPDRFSVEKVLLNDLSVAPCTGCWAREKLGRCIQEDDFQGLAAKIRAADVLILASPVYSLSVCAQAKALIDRCHVFWSQKYVLKTFTTHPGRRFGMFLATAGQPRGNVFDHAVPVARFLFDVSGITSKDTYLLLLSGVDHKGDFLRNSRAVAKAEDAAALFVESLEFV